jgi:enterochelin esterase-like enzyme
MWSEIRATLIALANVCLIAAAAAGPCGAQGRGGLRPGGGFRAGTVEHVIVHGKALEGNLEGDSPDRNVTVYLPPSYAGDSTRRFPVVYFLHEYGAHSDGPIDGIKEFADKLAGVQGFSEPIVVTADAYTLHKGSLYSTSATTGDWERFIAEDLVAYIDGHYRTLAARISRGLAGRGMGGYGAFGIGMKRPEVFSSLYIMSACCLAGSEATPEVMLPVGPLQREFLTAAESIKTRDQAERAAPGAGPSEALAAAAAWSPNPKNPPLFLDLPVKDGKVVPDVAAKWAAKAPLTVLEQNAENLRKYYAIAIEIGTKDAFLAPNQQLHSALLRLRIPHNYEEYDSDQKLSERFERNLLPFFSKSLAAPANPTSPGVH